MGSDESKPAATGDMKYMEIYSHGSTIYCSKWNKKYGFQGKLEKTAVRELSDKLRAATAGTPQGKKRKKLEAQLRVAVIWAEQAHKRTGGAEEGMIAAAISVKADEETGTSGSIDAARRAAIIVEHRRKEQRIKKEQEKERKDRERETQKRIDKEVADALSPLHTRNKERKTNLYPVEELKDAAEGSFNGEKGEVYPLVEVANPHFGVADDPERMLKVFRPWTMDECKKACEGLTPYKQDPVQFVLDHTALIASYGLNGHEVLRTLMVILGHEWARVKGIFTGTTAEGGPMPPGDQALTNALVPVYQAIERTFALRRDFTKVSGCRQGEKESVQDFRVRMEECFRIHSGIPHSNVAESAFVQQLKQSLMNGFHPGVADFIRKHNVNHRTCDLQECLNYAEHATSQIKEKRQKKASASAFFVGEGGENNEVFFVGPGQGRGGFNRGRGNGRVTGRGRGLNSDGKFLCHRCGREGHMARDCREERPQNKEGGQKGQYKDEKTWPPPPSHNLHSYDN